MMLATASVVLFGVTYFGALSSTVKAWQPLRFKVPLDLILVIAASYYASLSFGRSRSFSPFVGSAVVLGLLAFSLNVIQTESSGRLKLRSTFRPELTAIVEWIDRETPENARLLFEESGDESGFVYDRTYLSSFLPYLTGRQLIGGPINLYNDRHHFAEFHSGKLFQKARKRSRTRSCATIYASTTLVRSLPSIRGRFSDCYQFPDWLRSSSASVRYT
jgi:hypothetical protein